MNKLTGKDLNSFWTIQMSDTICWHRKLKAVCVFLNFNKEIQNFIKINIKLKICIAHLSFLKVYVCICMCIYMCILCTYLCMWIYNMHMYRCICCIYLHICRVCVCVCVFSCFRKLLSNVPGFLHDIKLSLLWSRNWG